jgi:hypothetical protein
VDSVVYQLAVSFWAALQVPALLGAYLRKKSVQGRSQFIPYLSAVVGEFSTALMLVGLFATLVALGGPFVKLAAFFEVFKNGVTVLEAFEITLFLGCMFSFIEICKLAYQRRGMLGQRNDTAYYLGKAEKYRNKAKAAGEPGLTAAFETVAREYMAKARELDPALSSSDGN